MSIDRRSMGRLLRSTVVLLVTIALGGCLEDNTEDPASLVEEPNPPATAEPGDPPPVVNHPPEITGTPPIAVQAGESYSFVPTAGDVDDDFLEFTIANKPDWAQFSDETGALSGTPSDAHVGETSDITITVTDGRDARSIGPFRIRINPRNQPSPPPSTPPPPTNPPPPSNPPPPTNTAPTISGMPGGAVMVDESYGFQPIASDPDGDTLRFSISNRPSWASFNSLSGALGGTPRTANIGTYSNIVISVNDGEASAAIGPFTIQVRGPDNRPPTIGGSPGRSVQATRSYSFTPIGNDPDGDNLTYSIANRPSWASFSSSSGRLSGTPATSHVGTYANIVISTSDGRASASLPAFSIEVQAAPNRAPTISGSPARSVDAGSAYSFRPTASDPDDDTLGFTIQNRPSWASFDTASGRLSGTPTSAHVRTFSNIVISVSDGRESASLPAFNIVVNTASNDPPTISGTPASSVNVGSSYTFQPSASDPDGDTLTYSIQSRPAWATFNTSTGRLSGTPTAAHAGVHSNIRISVSDGTASASLPAFSITVNQATQGSATLSWQPPTSNEDGSALTNLAGFRIAYGRSAASLDELVELANPGLTSHMITELTSGTWYFAVRAYTTSGAESDLSNLASKTIP